MLTATLKLEMLLRQSRSLKAKRRVVNSLKNRIHNEFLCAVAEVDHLDNPQRITLGIAVVGNDRRVLESALDNIRRYAIRHPEAQYASAERNFFWGDDAKPDIETNVDSDGEAADEFDSPVDIFTDLDE